MATSILSDLFEWLSWLFSTNFFVTLFGAFFGAWGAYFFARRAKRNDDLINELDAINACVLLSSDICSSLINLKKNHLMPMIAKYEKQQRVHLLWDSERRRTKNYTIPLKFEFDGFRIPKSVVPINDLHNMLFSRIRVNGRPKLVISALEQSLTMLLSVIEERNRLIDLQAEKQTPIDQLVVNYLGLPTKHGQDSTYKNLIRSSRRYVDDCIWFSDRIATDLNSYGTELRNKNRLKSIRVIKSNFDEETRKHIPDDKDFATYLKQAIHFDRKTEQKK